MKVYKIQAPDGSIIKIEGPEGASQEQLIQAAEAAYSAKKTNGNTKQTTAQQPKQESSVVGNFIGGAVRGAGSIGATILAPWDIAKDAYSGKGLSLESNRQRRADMDAGLRSLGVDTDSLAFQGGKMATEVAGTLPVGGILGKGVQTVAQGTKFAPAVAPVVTALRTGGMNAGGVTGAKGLALRAGAGAAVGGTSTAMISPEDAGNGAILQGALPVIGGLVKGGTALTREVLGKTTGAGSTPIKIAYESGKQGGKSAAAFRENITGKADMLDVLEQAKSNLDDIKIARSNAYKQNMAQVNKVDQPLDLSGIDESLNNAFNKFTFKGQAKDPKVLDTLNRAKDLVNNWKNLDPAQFHTPEGIDALKQQLSALSQNLPLEERASKAAIDGVVRDTKKLIESKAPEYAKAMKDYESASQIIKEIETSLSQNNRASADTAIRKLQSVMRNNANTNYGARLQSLNQLEQLGGRELQPALAGQSLSEWTPRGLQGATSPLLGFGGYSVGGIPGAAAGMAASSPRLAGESAYWLGATARRVDPAIQLLRSGAYKSAPAVVSNQNSSQ